MTYPPYGSPPAIEKKTDVIAVAGRIVILIALIAILVFVVSWVFGCDVIPVPGYCDFYWSIMGSPKTLIVYSDTGLGNPELLARELSNPKGMGIRTTSMHLNRISPALLDEYKLIIVTKAKKMSASQMKMFMEYVYKGGRLVWTGDAGTEIILLEGEDEKQAKEREFLFKDEDPEIKNYKESDVNSHEIINPWARKLGGTTIRFDRFISAAYIGNYCEELEKKCKEFNKTGEIGKSPLSETYCMKKSECETSLPYLGTIQINSPKHDTVIGLRNDWKSFGNIALVQVINSTSTLRVADISKPVDIGQTTIYPFIIEAGFGGKVLYYALPPEEFVNPELPSNEQGNQWISPHIISNMYIAAVK
ncbi:MAG: hypothetical protein ABIA76_06235 [Candidatus Diapherotrites archaeon]